ncbi:hypothetical protein HDV05_007399 [Chytridiales sp. JEL 0842]|nr:hypothetical protein HDV05_007399 [Chytridiales sp. JEL 0842]
MIVTTSALLFLISAVQASWLTWNQPHNELYSGSAVRDVHRTLLGPSDFDSIASVLRQLDLFQEGKKLPVENIPLATSSNEYSLVMPVPGHNSKTINLDLTEGGTVLRVSGKAATEYIPPSMIRESSEKNAQKARGRYVERIEGLVALPWDADTHNMAAAVENGVLKVRIPRRGVTKDTEHIPVHDNFAEIELPTLAHRAYESIMHMFGANDGQEQQQQPMMQTEQAGAHKIVDRVYQAAGSIKDRVSNVFQHAEKSPPSADAQIQARIAAMEKSYKDSMKSAQMQYSSMTEAARQSASSMFASLTQAAKYPITNAAHQAQHVYTQATNTVGGAAQGAYQTVMSSVPSAFAQATQAAYNAAGQAANQAGQMGSQAAGSVMNAAGQVGQAAGYAAGVPYHMAERAAEGAYHAAEGAAEGIYQAAGVPYQMGSQAAQAVYTAAGVPVQMASDAAGAAYHAAEQAGAHASQMGVQASAGASGIFAQATEAVRHVGERVAGVFHHGADQAKEGMAQASQGMAQASQSAHGMYDTATDRAKEAFKTMTGTDGKVYTISAQGEQVAEATVSPGAASAMPTEGRYNVQPE